MCILIKTCVSENSPTYLLLKPPGCSKYDSLLMLVTPIQTLKQAPNRNTMSVVKDA